MILLAFGAGVLVGVIIVYLLLVYSADGEYRHNKKQENAKSNLQ
jgi:hypothetical protein